MTIDITHLSAERRALVADIIGQELAHRVKDSARNRDAGLESQAEGRLVARVIAHLGKQIEILTESARPASR